MAPTSRVIDASLGKMPTTFVRRLISALSRSSGFVHQSSELGELAAQLIGHRSPLRSRRIGRLLHEHRADRRRDHAPLGLAGMRQGVPHEVHPAALPGGLQDLRYGRLDALVAVADDELDAA